MNILLDELPEAIEINGVAYPINWDHRTGIECILDFESDEFTLEEKAVLLLSRLYRDALPDDVNEAVRLGLKFLNGGQESEEEGNPFANTFRLYSFEKDARLIYAAFRQTHGIDLQKITLHWWVFFALFLDLGAETSFCSLINLRHRIKSGEANKYEREQARKLGSVFDLPEDETLLSENENENLALFEALLDGER